MCVCVCVGGGGGGGGHNIHVRTKVHNSDARSDPQTAERHSMNGLHLHLAAIYGGKVYTTF